MKKKKPKIQADGGAWLKMEDIIVRAGCLMLLMRGAIELPQVRPHGALTLLISQLDGVIEEARQAYDELHTAHKK